MKDSTPISPIRLDYFPRDPQFWFYHLAGVALFLMVQVVIGMVLGDKPRLLGFEAIAFVVWAVGFTLSALILRIKYTQWAKHSWPTPKLILCTLGLVLALALCIFLLMASIAMPPYWDQLMAQELKVNPDQTSAGFLIELTVGNWFSGSMILSCWLFIYIGISKSREVKKSQLTNLRLQNSLKEAQLSSLSNQLNPHFLFNSLNNIRFMIHENANQADEMITSLSQVLRYSLESSQYEKLPLHKEVEIIHRYVGIVSIQFEKRFRFNMDIPETLHNYLVPPMLLQMLIENAVKHGVEQLEQGSTISVTATSDNDRLSIEVVNDAPAKANAINGGTGIGLKNIEQRLDILYAQAATFSAQLEGNRFRVLIILPIETSLIGTP